MADRRAAASASVAIIVVVAVASVASVWAFSFMRSGSQTIAKTSRPSTAGLDQSLQSALARLASVRSSTSSQGGSAQAQPASTPAQGDFVAPVTDDLSANEVVLTVVPSVEYNHSYYVTPIHVVVGVNNTVVWINTDSTWHAIISLNGTYNSGNIWPGNEFEYTFTHPGSYTYACPYHPSMRGTIIVTG